jgi:circadian clock protein KaiC
MDKILSGIVGFDSVLGGGLPQKTVTLLSGGPGSGKTLLALSFLLEGAAKGERCCYISLGETCDELLRACDGITALKGARRYVGKNLAIEHVVMGENTGISYFAKIFAAYPQVDRLVVDNVNRLLIAAEDPREYRLKLSDILRFLKEKVSCTLLICETEEDRMDTGNGEAFECDGVISLSFLELEEKPKRTIEVAKMRYSSFEPRIPHEFIIDNKGLKVTETKIL